MLDSFRTRLTVWYTVVLGLLLVGFSIGFYSLLSRVSRGRLDAGLENAVQVTALSLNHEIEEHGGQVGGEDAIRAVLATMLQTSFARQTVVIFDGRRFIAGKLGSEGMALDAVGLLTPGESETRFAEMTWHDRSYRTASRNVFVPFINRRYQVMASESTDATEVELAGVRRALAWCVPLGMLLAAAGGTFLAGRSLEPVREMAAAARRISSSTLHERLAVHNPRDELGALATTFNELLERLDQAFAQQRQFMADASHELRTPLFVALTAAQVNLEGDETGLRSAADYREALRIVNEQLRRLRRIVQDMFLIARADAGVLQPSFGTVYLDELIDDAVRAARVIGARKQAQIGWSGEREAAYIGDEELLRQMMLILLDNAVRHIGEQGCIQVTLAREPAGDAGAYRLTVRDNGSGIAAADRARIFERFYHRAGKPDARADRLSGGGAGLGLAIARSIVTLHHGTITLAPADGPGATFVVTLPASRERSVPPRPIGTTE